MQWRRNNDGAIEGRQGRSLRTGVYLTGGKNLQTPGRRWLFVVYMPHPRHHLYCWMEKKDHAMQAAESIVDQVDRGLA